MPTAWEAMYPFGVSLAIGALVGIDRERKRLRTAPEEQGTLPGGIRTFPLIALLGCSAGWLGEHYGTIVFAVIAGGFAVLTAAIYVMTSLKGDLGATTEVAGLLTFVLGAMVQGGAELVAGAVAVAMTVLLSSRDRLRNLALKIEPDDLYATLTLAVVTVIVLPLLPDRGMGPWGVWNPFSIWLLVVFISAIGFVGFVGMRLVGPGRGLAIAGLLGGLASSTATTLSFSGRCREAPALAPALALGIALAWAAMFVRVALEIAAVNSALLDDIVPAIAAATLAGVGGAALLMLRNARGEKATDTSSKVGNPFSLKSALKFGAIFAVVLVVAKAAQVYFADLGVLVAAGLTGLLDVDAMALSAARLAKEGQLSETTAARAILLAAAANTLMKAILAVALGSWALGRALVPIAAVTLLAGGAVAVLRG